MGTRTYTDEQRDEAVALAVEVGVSEAARRLGIDKGSVSRWAKAAGASTLRREQTAAATEARVAAWEQRRTELAHRIGAVAELALGKAEGALHDGTSSKAKDYATTMAILVDKAQLLTGGATARPEHAASAARAAQVLDEVTARRARHDAARGDAAA